MERFKPLFPLSHGVPRVDETRVLSGIILINRNGLRWRDAPPIYGPHKTVYNLWYRWSGMGVFAKILLELVRQDTETEMIMTDATHLKAHRTASSLRKKMWRACLIGLSMILRLPTPWQKFRQARGRQVGDQGDDVGKPGLWVNIVQLGGAN